MSTERRRNHRWPTLGAAPTGVEDCQHGCGAQRAIVGGAIRWRPNQSARWAKPAPTCTSSPRITAPVGVTVPAIRPIASIDDLYLSLKEPWRLVMGCCVVGQMRQEFPAAQLGVTRQRVEQIISSIYALAERHGVTLPPRPGTNGTPWVGGHGHVAFRAAAHRRLGRATTAERDRAAKINRLRAGAHTTLTSTLAWCSKCESWKPRIGGFSPARFRCKTAGAKSAWCKRCVSRYYVAKEKANREAGLCGCGASPTPGMVSCENCRAVQTRYNANREAETARWGVCFECRENPREEGKTCCAPCLVKKSASQAAYYRRRTGAQESG